MKAVDGMLTRTIKSLTEIKLSKKKSYFVYFSVNHTASLHWSTIKKRNCIFTITHKIKIIVTSYSILTTHPSNHSQILASAHYGLSFLLRTREIVENKTKPLFSGVCKNKDTFIIINYEICHERNE